MSLEEIIKKVNKQFKKEIGVKGIKDLSIKRIPFSSLRLNYMTYGGIPRGRVIEFSGEESSGKTTTALDIVSQSQYQFKTEWQDEIESLKQRLEEGPKITERKELTERLQLLQSRGPLKVVYIDQEGTLDLEWALKLKVDPEEIYILRLQEQTAEQILDIALEIISEGDTGLLIIDSIAMLISQQIYDESLEKKSYGGNASVVTGFINRAVPRCGSTGCTCIVVNQVREDLDNPYNMYKTPCGKALKHQCSVRMVFKKGSPIDSNGKAQAKNFDAPQGNLVSTTLLKTKVCKPDRRLSEFIIDYDNGIDIISDLIFIATQNDIIKGKGWYTIVNPATGEYFMDENKEILKIHGEPNLIQLLRANNEIFKCLYQYCYQLVSNNLPKISADLEMSDETVNFAQEQCKLDEVFDELIEEENIKDDIKSEVDSLL